MMNKIVKLSAPWDTFQKMVKALFENDKDVNVGALLVDDGGKYNYILPIEVKNHEKYLALDRVMPACKTFGNIMVGIQIYDEENSITGSIGDLYKKLFEGNSILDSVIVTPDFAGTEHVYVQFAPEVVQFFDDDTSDYNGNWNGLAEDIAVEVFGEEMTSPFIHFCTAAKEKAE